MRDRLQIILFESRVESRIILFVIFILFFGVIEINILNLGVKLLLTVVNHEKLDWVFYKVIRFSISQ